MREQLTFEVPDIGEVLLEPTVYHTGRRGYMAITEKQEFNITLDWECNKPIELFILKLHHPEARAVVLHLLKTTDLFGETLKSKFEPFGQSLCYVTELNPDYE